MQRAGMQIARERSVQMRPSLATIRDLQTYEYTISGATEEEVIGEAQTRALKSAAARLYFGQHFLLGRDLLEPYLRQNGAKFIARTTVLERGFLVKDQIEARVRVSVNLDAFYKDLQEKKFLGEPNLRPIIAVHLQEIIEGKRDNSSNARSRIEQAMQGNLFRVNSKKITSVPLDADLSTAEELLAKGRMEAQRQDVDILITGTLSVRPLSQEQILFDEYDFMETEVDLKMYRVDNGELLASKTARYSARGYDRDDAIKNSLDSMLASVSGELAGQLHTMWGNTMLDEGNIRLMISNIDRDEITGVYNFLHTLDPRLELFEKAYYGDVVVVNVVLPDAAPEKLEKFLRESSEPQFNVKRVEERKFELDLL